MFPIILNNSKEKLITLPITTPTFVNVRIVGYSPWKWDKYKGTSTCSFSINTEISKINLSFISQMIPITIQNSIEQYLSSGKDHRGEPQWSKADEKGVVIKNTLKCIRLVGATSDINIPEYVIFEEETKE